MDFRQFKRLNFFNGLFTSADDWKAEARYHADKRQLHNTTLHSPGVVTGLEVKALGDGTGIRVSRGSAVDPAGRDLYLDDDIELPIPFDSYQLPQAVQVVLRYAEEGVEWRQDAANKQHADYAYMEESAAIAIEPQAGAQSDAVTLATIRLARDARKVRDAQNAVQPQENEIDTRAVRRAGAVGAIVTLKQIAKGVMEGRADVAARSRDSGPEDEYVGIPLPETGEGLVFVATVYPLGEGQINWRMGSSRRGSTVQYKLYIRNVETRAVSVGFRVYRLE